MIGFHASLWRKNAAVRKLAQVSKTMVSETSISLRGGCGSAATPVDASAVSATGAATAKGL